MLPFIWSLCLQQHTKFWKAVNATLTEYSWLAVVNQLGGRMGQYMEKNGAFSFPKLKFMCTYMYVFHQAQANNN